MNAIFVYGTLRFVNPFREGPLGSIKGFDLYISRHSSIPGIDYSKDPNSKIIGNIRTFDPVEFKIFIRDLDFFEGATFDPPSYFRKIVKVKLSDGSSIPAYVYIMNFIQRNKKEYIRIIDGDYKAFLKRRKQIVLSHFR